MIPLFVYGSGGHAREVFEVIRCLNDERPQYRFLGWIDDHVDRCGAMVKGYRVLDWPTAMGVMPTNGQVFIAIGAPAARRRVASLLEAASIPSPALVHPRAWVGGQVALGPGTQVAAGAMMSTDVTTGRHVIINQGCTVAHDVRLGDFATLAPGASLSGNVTTEEGADVGTGAVVIQGLRLGAWSVVGAGAVVTQSVPANATVVGVPAQVIRQRPAGWHECTSDMVSP